MFKYYSYYSIGGYKDMFLGDSETTDEFTYFLPLLPVWKKRAEENADTVLAERVKYLETLPSIKLLKQSETWGLPSDANVMISHGGYKLLLKSSTRGCRILAINEISSMDKDEEGRSIPFLMLITASSDIEKEQLALLFSYISSNMRAVEAKFAGFISYDEEVNGYRFKLAEMTKWIKTVTSGLSTMIRENGRVVDLNNDNNDFIVKSSGVDDAKVLLEQDLSKRRTVFLSGSNISQLEGCCEDNLPEIFCKKNLILIAASIATGLILGLLIGKSIWGRG